MAEPRVPKAEKSTTALRPRQTIRLNESTNEAVPRKGIKRRTDIGDGIPPIPPLPKGGETDTIKE